MPTRFHIIPTGLTSSYPSHAEFGEHIRGGLLRAIRDILREAGEPILAESLEPQTVDTSTYDAALALANEYEQVRHCECRRRTHPRDDYGVFPNESPGSEGTSACNEIRAE